MNKQEYLRLYSYHRAASYSPWKPIRELKGRSRIKGQAKGVGQILKDSSIRYQTPLER